MDEEPAKENPYKRASLANSGLKEEPQPNRAVQDPEQQEGGGSGGSEHQQKVQKRSDASDEQDPGHHMLNRDAQKQHREDDGDDTNSKEGGAKDGAKEGNSAQVFLSHIGADREEERATLSIEATIGGWNGCVVISGARHSRATNKQLAGRKKER